MCKYQTLIFTRQRPLGPGVVTISHKSPEATESDLNTLPGWTLRPKALQFE